MKDLPRFNNFLNEDIAIQQNTSLDELTSDLVSELMNAATSFHKLHLKVKDLGSFAAHSALQTLYDELPGHADTLAESFQGSTEKLLQYREFPPKVLNTVNDGLAYATQLKEMVNNLQSKMPYSEIVNDLDLVKSSINAVKYKLIFLK